MAKLEAENLFATGININSVAGMPFN